MDHSDSHPLHQRRKKWKRPERDTIWLSYLVTSLTSPLSLSPWQNAHTQTHLNPAKVRADQQWHKTWSERNEDSEITKTAEFGLPQPHSILPFITTNKPGILNHNLSNSICCLQQTRFCWNSDQCDITEGILYGFLLLEYLCQERSDCEACSQP